MGETTQQTFGLEGGGHTVEEVLASLRRLRIKPITYEADLQKLIAEQLAQDGIAHQREFKLGKGNKIDFLVAGGIGIEVKKGKPDSSELAAQAERYAAFDQVHAMVPGGGALRVLAPGGNQREASPLRILQPTVGDRPVTIPKYLVRPDQTGYMYGTVEFDPTKERFTVRAEPAVLEMAKRVFPGCETKVKGQIRFKATTRAVGDLTWLMQRFPMKVDNIEMFDRYRVRAIDHALRRDTNMRAFGPAAPPPTFTGVLKPFQAEGVGFMVRNERTGLFDDMGLGKTVQGLAALATAEAFPALVVAPSNTLRQWQRMVGTFLNLQTEGQQSITGLPLDPQRSGERMAHIIKGLKPYPLPKVPIYLTHYGLLAAWKDVLLELGLQAVEFDEIQELRRLETAKYSAASLIAGSARYVWGLSGTPIYNYGEEIWAVLNILDYHCLGDKDSFTREWCVGYGSKEVAEPDVLNDYLKREGLMLRRRKADVQDQLPPKRRVVHVVEKDEAKYGKLIAQAVELAQNYDGINNWHEKGQTKRLIEGAARRAAGIAKAPYVASFVRALLEAGERVLLYAYHHDVHEILAEELVAFGPVQITGRQTPKEKDTAVEAFALRRTPLIQLSLRATAGLDRLQQAGTVVVFAELDWSPAIHSQCEDRLQRIGVDESLESILCYYMVTDSGMDETMMEALGLKVGQFVGIMGDQASSAEDDVLAQQAAERHMDRVIERLKSMKAG